MTEVISVHEWPVDLFRAVNILLTVYVLARMAVSWRRFVTASRAQMMYRLALGLLVAATGWGSVETIIAHQTAPGFRTYAFTVALVWSALAIHFETRDKPGRGSHDRQR